MTRLLLLLLLVLPVDGITSVVPAPSGGGSSCNEFTETDWDNLTGWTQDSQGDWSVDATNDELDYTAGASDAWIINDTTTTGGDHCVLWQFVVYADDGNSGPLLRASGVGNDAYAIVRWAGTYEWDRFTLNAGSAGYQGTIDSNATPDPSSGDYLGACVNGTGTSTVMELWHWTSDPGSVCRTDWGTADWTSTADPGADAVDTGDQVGFIGGSDNNQTLDDFAGSDY